MCGLCKDKLVEKEDEGFEEENVSRALKVFLFSTTCISGAENWSLNSEIAAISALLESVHTTFFLPWELMPTKDFLKRRRKKVAKAGSANWEPPWF